MSAFRRSDNYSARPEPAAAAKRQKTSSGYVATSGVIELSSDVEDDIASSPPASYVTQPTQLLDRSSTTPTQPAVPAPVVQVPASSPFQPKVTQQRPAQPPPPIGKLAMTMAPAGTSFRQPFGTVRAPSPRKKEFRDLSDDDGPRFKAISSDEDEVEVVNPDIKPSSFVVRKPADATFPSKPASMPTTKSFDLTSFVFDPTKTKPQAAATIPRSQTRPDRPRAIEDISLESIVDSREREKVRRLRVLYPNASVVMCKDTLTRHDGDYNDAAADIAEKFVTVPSDDDSKRRADMPQMKRQLKQPVKSIHERWNATQNLTVRSPTTSPEKPKAQPRRRLVQGRKTPTSPAERTKSLSPSPPPRARPEPVVLSDEDSDSAVGSASDSGDLDVEQSLLKWLNTCTAEQLADLANIKKPEAEGILSTRPFRSLDHAREYSNAPPIKNGRKTRRVPAGERIVNAAVEMWGAYQAVDELVNQCNAIAKPLKTEMATWGFNAFGASMDGELELVSFDDGAGTPRDSGLGTPQSLKTADSHDDDIRVASRPRKSFLSKPAMMNDEVVLKDYQVVGLNWLDLLYRHKLSCILADDMGLGKTCQVITFLSHLTSLGNQGPHLVIVPGSTLENWLREFHFFSPGLVVEPYYGPQNERREISESILERRSDINVVVTTYDMAAKPLDNKFLRRLRPDVCVYDEGHLLKNPNSLRYQGLVKIPATFRLLLTGTPLQNNLKELTALLSFILPQVFNDLKDDLDFIFKNKATTADSDHGALLSDQRTARARSMLTPFVLRRKKEQVLKYLPAKTCRVEFCDLHPVQAEIYAGHVEQAVRRAKLRLEGAKVPKTEENNPLMQLRKAAIHPLLFRRHFTDENIEVMADILRKKESESFPSSQARNKLIDEMRGLSDFWLHGWCAHHYPSIRRFDVDDGSWMHSGKVQALARLVKEYKANGDRVLVFSQFSLVLDILETVLGTLRIQFTRIDGSTPIDERQTLIDQFRDEEDITVFLLTTKAGGTGLNLTYANKVIIFDSSFNPQDDAQAENRAHRLGQTKEVEVIRLVTRGTVEEQIHALGQSKLELDNKVAGADEAAAEAQGEKMVEKLLLEAGHVDNEG